MAVTTSSAVLGLFRDPAQVAEALDALRETGFDDAHLEVLSDSPYPEGAFGERAPDHRLYVFPFVGAACGLAVGLLVTIGTQLAYPLVTGGKPILSIPPMLIVIFEGTMLGAIIFTVLGLIFESRLPDFHRLPYDARISEGYLGVLVMRTEGHQRAAEVALTRAGAVEIVTHEAGPGDRPPEPTRRG